MKIPLFIDFEASSLSLLDSYPIEVGICLSSGEVKSWLITPHVLWRDWSVESERVHGISKDILLSEGVHYKSVAEQLNQVIGHQTIYCDAVAHDSFWLHRLFRASGIKPHFSLECIMTLLDKDKRGRWQSTRQSIINKQKLITHRAGTDAFLLHKTWSALNPLSGLKYRPLKSAHPSP